MVENQESSKETCCGSRPNCEQAFSGLTQLVEHLIFFDNILSWKEQLLGIGKCWESEERTHQYTQNIQESKKEENDYPEVNCISKVKDGNYFEMSGQSWQGENRGGGFGGKRALPWSGVSSLSFVLLSGNKTETYCCKQVEMVASQWKYCDRDRFPAVRGMLIDLVAKRRFYSAPMFCKKKENRSL